MGPQESCVPGSATCERDPRATGSTCTVTSPGLANTSALWIPALLPLTLASVPRTGLLRYPGPLCLCLCVPECPCMGPGSLQEEGQHGNLSWHSSCCFGCWWLR